MANSDQLVDINKIPSSQLEAVLFARDLVMDTKGWNPSKEHSGWVAKIFEIPDGLKLGQVAAAVDSISSISAPVLNDFGSMRGTDSRMMSCHMPPERLQAMRDQVAPLHRAASQDRSR